ncbi:MAG: ribonuclease P protein component [Nostocoides sp.]
MLPARHRLTHRGDIANVLRGAGAVRVGTRLMVIHAISVDTEADCPPRVGFAVSKAVGSAVVRNRVRRRLRAQMARRIFLLPWGVDVLVRAQPIAASATSLELGHDLDAGIPRVVTRLSASTGGGA